MPSTKMLTAARLQELGLPSAPLDVLVPMQRNGSSGMWHLPEHDAGRCSVRSSYPSDVIRSLRGATLCTTCQWPDLPAFTFQHIAQLASQVRQIRTAVVVTNSHSELLRLRAVLQTVDGELEALHLAAVDTDDADLVLALGRADNELTAARASVAGAHQALPDPVPAAQFGLLLLSVLDDQICHDLRSYLLDHQVGADLRRARSEVSAALDNQTLDQDALMTDSLVKGFVDYGLPGFVEHFAGQLSLGSYDASTLEGLVESLDAMAQRMSDLAVDVFSHTTHDVMLEIIGWPHFGRHLDPVAAYTPLRIFTSPTGARTAVVEVPAVVAEYASACDPRCSRPQLSMVPDLRLAS